MAWVSFIILATTLANFVLAGAVLWRRHTRPLHFAFAFFSASAGVWTLSNFIVSLMQDPLAFEWAGRFAFAVAVWVPFSGLLLSWHFPETYHPSPRRFTLLAAAGATLLVSVLSLTPLVQKTVNFTEEGPMPEFGSLYFLYALFVTATIVWLVWNLLRSRWKTPSGRDRMQINYCLAGLAVTFVGAYVCNFILPQVITRHQYYLLGSAWPLAWTSMTAYAICRYRLMDIGVALRNLLTHAIVSATLLLVFLLPFAAHRWFMEDELLLPQIVFFVGVAGLTAFYLPRFERAVKHFIDHRVFRGRYDYETAMISFGNDLRRAFGSDNIARFAVRQIPIIIQGCGVAIYLPESKGESYVLTTENGLPCGERLPRLSAEHPLMHRVAYRQQMLSREDVAYHRKPEAQALAAVLETCQAVLAAPLVSQGQTIGLMLLGEKQHDNVYSLDDLRLIDALASQLAFALDNARLYQQVLESERLYEAVLRHMQRAVIAVDAELRLVMLNNTAEELFGLNPEQGAGQPIDPLLPSLGNILAATLARGENQAPQEIMVEIDGRLFPCECETSIMQDSEGRGSGVLVVCQDLSERKKFEEEIRKMDRLASVGTLAAGIAHEIKNPLVSIQTFAQLLPERHQNPEFRERFGAVVQSEITRINRLILNLLNFARPEANESSWTDLHQLLDRAVNLLENEFKNRRVTMTRDYLDGPASVVGDAKQLYQVFINVLQNALHFIDGDRPTVVIATRRREMNDSQRETWRGVEVSFTDNGCGIASENLPHIFDPFFSTREEGSGLGLAICHGILHNHKAHIDVRSKPGVETVFSFTIPENAGREEKSESEAGD